MLDELLGEAAIDAFSPEDRRTVAQRWHDLAAWPDFVPAVTRLRPRYVCVSFTILSLSLVIDVSRRNGITWDAVIPCEMLRVYKTRPEAYQLAAKFLGVPPSEILMVACHNFDLDAARGQGYRTAFVRRPDEWGPSGPPDPVPNPATDLAVAGFAELAERLDAPLVSIGKWSLANPDFIERFRLGAPLNSVADLTKDSQGGSVMR